MTAVTWDPNHKTANMSLSNGNLDASDVGNNTHEGVRATIPRDDEPVMVSFEVIAERSVDDMYTALCDSTQFAISGGPFGGFVGQSSFHVVWRGGGGLFIDGSAITTIASYITGDVVDYAYNPANGKFWLRKNGGAWIGGGDPTLGTTPTGQWTILNTTYACHFTDNSPPSTYKMRLHASGPSFVHPAPSGYAPYDPGSIVQPRLWIST